MRPCPGRGQALGLTQKFKGSAVSGQPLDLLVGATGFEPTTPTPAVARATRNPATPSITCPIIGVTLPSFCRIMPTASSFRPACGRRSRPRPSPAWPTTPARLFSDGLQVDAFQDAPACPMVAPVGDAEVFDACSLARCLVCLGYGVTNGELVRPRRGGQSGSERHGLLTASRAPPTTHGVPPIPAAAGGYVDNSLPRVLAHTHCATTTALSLRNPMVDP